MLQAYNRLLEPQSGQHRLTEAKAIANEVAHKAGKDALDMPMKTTTEGRPTWHVSTSGIGYGWFVVIDDERGLPGPLTERTGR